MRFIISFFVLVLIFSTPVMAEDVSGGFEKRKNLAEIMHKIKPVRDQIYSAIDLISLRLPEEQREIFKTNMRRVVDFRVVEKISINAMANTFTIEELQAMIEYNQKPEAKSASEKYSDYQKEVGVAISQLLDKAMMRVRTGVSSQN